MKRLKHIILAAMLLCSFPLMEGAPKWEHVSAAVLADEGADTERVEVTVKDGYIYIDTQRPVTVKLMSILGQLVSQQNLPAGLSRLKMNSRGIYILKAGSFTKRVTV